VVVLTQFFPPETFAGANRVGSMVAALSKPHEVVVITLCPSYPSPDVYDLRDALAHDRQQHFRIDRTTTFVPHARSLAVRAVREHIMAIRLGMRAAREPADIVVTSSPSMFLAPVAWVLARAKSGQLAWDIRDIGWEYAGESRLASGRLAPHLLKALRRYMWFIARRADIIVAATPGIAEAVARHVGPDKTIAVIGNSVSRELRVACERCREHVPKPRPRVAYVGLIGDAQGLLVLADVARLLPAVDFVVAGDGPERARLEQKVREMGLRNFELMGYLPRADVLEVYRQSDVLFAQLNDTPTLNATGLPSKLHEYMATGKPVVYAGKGLAPKLIAEVGSGLAVPPGDARAIAAAIDDVLRSETRAAAMGACGRAFIDALPDRETAFDGLLQALDAR
jgi:colanic acid biosynthesis glycosyl transferase WcaI